MTIQKTRLRRTAYERAGPWIAATAICLVFPLLAQAGEFPSSGEATFDRYVTTNVAGPGPVSVRRGVVFTDVAISRHQGTEGPWYGLVDRCAGQFAMLGEEVTHGFGTCVKRDAQGDAMFVSWQGEKWTILGGTGKYEGITGSGTTTVSPGRGPRQVGLAAWDTVVHHSVRWQISSPKPLRQANQPGVANAGLGG